MMNPEKNLIKAIRCEEPEWGPASNLQAFRATAIEYGKIPKE
jgi:hypothetical protein